MSAADEFIQSFGADSDEERCDAFEASSLSLLLKQLGAPAKWVKQQQRELGPDFGFAWFNGLGYINPVIRSTRVMNYNLTEIFTAPSRSVAVQDFMRVQAELIEEGYGGQAFCIIFKCYKLGRLIATNMLLSDYTHMHVAFQDHKLNILPMSGFFAKRYGNVFEGV